jgi:hypothetical protein
MASNPDNVKKLRAEKVIKRGLPAPYLKVFEKLSPQEMKVIVDEAARVGRKVATRDLAPEEWHGFVAF